MNKMRKLKKSKKYVLVACEGPSEEEYIKYFKKKFNSVADIYPIVIPGTKFFPELMETLTKTEKANCNIELIGQNIDEIWLFFDVEEKDKSAWDNRKKILKDLQEYNQNMHIRLLMTSGCVEYWFLLHYKKKGSPVITESEKDRVINELKSLVPSYEKGDQKSTCQIAENYKTAIKNSDSILCQVIREENINDKKELDRNAQLFISQRAFSTVHEALNYLISISPNIS